MRKRGKQRWRTRSRGAAVGAFASCSSGPAPPRSAESLEIDQLRDAMLDPTFA